MTVAMLGRRDSLCRILTRPVCLLKCRFDGNRPWLTLLPLLQISIMGMLTVRNLCMTRGVASLFLPGRLLATVMVLPNRTPQATPAFVVPVVWTVRDLERPQALLLRPRNIRGWPENGVLLT